jgi:hypothetical protein
MPLESKQSSSPIQHKRETTSDPIIFLRKWIGDVSTNSI